MKKAEKKAILDAACIAYYSGFGGIEIKEIQYGIEDYIIYTAGAWTSQKTAHKSKVYYNSENPFFRYHNYKISLSDCIRADY